MRRDLGGRAQDEGALPEQGVRDRQLAGMPGPAAPQHNIEIERARAPALSAPVAAEGALDILQIL